MPAYSASDALAFAKTMVKKMPLDDATVQYQILDYIADRMWMAAPWRWSVGLMPTVSVVAGQTDYIVTTPTDFLYLETAYLVDSSKSENTLTPAAVLPPLAHPGLPTKVAFMAGAGPSGTDILRIHPTPPTSYTATLVSIYKKLPTKIIASNAATAGITGIPDTWFWVYQLGVLWLSYHYADDAQRAGLAATNAQGGVQYSGFLGVFNDALNEMKRAEKLLLEKQNG